MGVTPQPPFTPDDVLREAIAEDVRVGPGGVVAVQVRTVERAASGELRYVRHIHIAAIDGSVPPFILTEGSAPQWISHPDGPGDGYLGRLSGRLMFLRDGDLWTVEPRPGATPALFAHFDEGPIDAFDCAAGGNVVACRVTVDSAPYNASYDALGRPIRLRQQSAGDVDDGRGGVLGAARRQLFVIEPQGPGRFAYADVTGHLTGAGDSRPGAREIELFAVSPRGTIAFTSNLEAGHDTSPGKHVYVLRRWQYHNVDIDGRPDLPLEPRRVTREPRLVTSLGWNGEMIMITTPGQGREQVPGAHHTVAFLNADSATEPRYVTAEGTVGFGPLFGAGDHLTSPPRALPGGVPVNARHPAHVIDPRVYFQANTPSPAGATANVYRFDSVTYLSDEPLPSGWERYAMGRLQPVFSSPERSVRRFAVAPGPLVLDERMSPVPHDDLVVVAMSAHDPSQVLVVRPGREPRPLLTLPSPFDDRARPARRMEWMPTGRGVDVPVLDIEPIEPNGETVFFVKGGPNTTASLHSYLPLLDSLAALGFRVYAPNLVGYDVDDEEHKLSLHGRWGIADRDDAFDVLSGIAARHGRSPNGRRVKVIGVGVSAGAKTVASMLAHDPSVFSGVVLERGVLDLLTKYLACDDPRLSPGQFGDYAVVRRRAEDQLLARLPELAPHLPPIALLQGGADFRTNDGQSLALMNGLGMFAPERAGHHHRDVFPGANHGVTFVGQPEQRVAYLWSTLSTVENQRRRLHGLPTLSPDELRARMVGIPIHPRRPRPRPAGAPVGVLLTPPPPYSQYYNAPNGQPGRSASRQA